MMDDPVCIALWQENRCGQLEYLYTHEDAYGIRSNVKTVIFAALPGSYEQAVRNAKRFAKKEKLPLRNYLPPHKGDES